MALRTPAELTSLRWYKADAMSLADDDLVASWTDLSSNADPAVQATDTKKPRFKTAVLNGLPVMRFDGGDYLEFGEILDSLSSTASIFVIAKRTGGTEGALLSTRPTSLSTGWTLRLNTGTAGLYFHTGKTPNISFTTVDAQFNLVEILRNGASITVGVNGTWASPVTLSGYNSSAYNKTSLGAENQGSSSLLVGDIAEILVLPYVADADTYQWIEGYIMHRYGLQASLPTGHPYKTSPPETATLVRAALDQPYDLLNVFLRSILEQPYGLMVRLAQLFDQVYGLKMLVAFHQYYGDAAQLRRGFDQRYGDAAKLRRKFEQLYGDKPRYRAALDQLYNLHAGLRAGFEQNYSIAEGQIKAALEQLYNIQDRDLLRATLDMLYVLAAGEALVQSTDIEVTCDGIVHTSMSNINVEQDDSSFHMSGDLQLYDEAEALQYRPFASAVTITVDGWTCQLICGFMREPRTPGQTIYVVPLFSRTILLDAPHSRLAAGELSGMASALVATLAAPFTVSWQLVDWFIPPGRLAVNEGDAAINVIRRITEAVGGIIQTDPDGVLICRPEYPVSVDKWDTATPDHYLTDQDDFFQVAPAPELRDGYNLVQVSDQQLSHAGEKLEPTEISPTKKEERVYQVPWDDRCIINLLHSGDPAKVSITAEGVKNEIITAEMVEIVGGSGSTSKPFYELLTAEYDEANLGEITITEDGAVTTKIADNSLLYITYTTKCWLFTVVDYNEHAVQFFPEVIYLP